MSQLTTHILNTTLGKPAEGVVIELSQKNGDSWKALSSGLTNSDGRVGDLLPKGEIMQPGIYRLVFHTGDYFKKINTACFYPQVAIEFQVSDASHYHVPLLLNPYGYSTYRGS